MVLLDSRRVPRVPRYSETLSSKFCEFYLRDYHSLWFRFPADSAIHKIFDLPKDLQILPIRPHNTEHTTLAGLTYIRFGLFPFRSPLLWESLSLSFPESTEMFQFPSFASITYVFSNRYPGIIRDGFPHSEIYGSKPV